MDAILAQVHPPKALPTSPLDFALPAGSGQRVEIIRLIPVEVTHDRSGHTATAVPFGIKVTRANLRDALLALQLHVEWTFVDFSVADGDALTAEDKKTLERLAGYLAMPSNLSAALTLHDHGQFHALPSEEKKMILERQARLFPPDMDEGDG